MNPVQTYIDPLGRKQVRVKTMRGSVFITRTNPRASWEVWDADQLGIISRHTQLRPAIYAALRLSRIRAAK